MMLAYPNILLLAGDEQEAMNLQQLLSPYVSLTCAPTLAALGLLLKNGAYDALFCTESPRAETWNEVIREVHKHHPDLPVIILSRTGDEREWRDVLEAGAFDLLAPPYQGRTLVAVLEQAVASRQARGWHDAGILLAKEHAKAEEEIPWDFGAVIGSRQVLATTGRETIGDAWIVGCVSPGPGRKV